MINKNGLHLDSLKGKQINSQLTVYEMAKQEMRNELPLPDLAIAEKQKEIDDWFNKYVDCYAMLLCKDNNYDCTIFHLYENPPANPHPTAVAARECIGCLTDRGKILKIELQDDMTWEMWVLIDDEAFCYHLFCYDNAVIEC